MAIIDLAKLGLYESIRKELNRDVTVYLDHPALGAGFKVDLPSGIYQMARIGGKMMCRRIAFYNYVITRTELQQPNREKFAAAIAAWQGLTLDQKKIYNERAVGRNFSGYNLFIRNYMHG